nr:hypothetical protein [Tanacetum cinerariifolium]
MVAAAKLLVLNPNEFELWKMRTEQYFLMTDYALWEVILNGDSPPLTRTIKGVVTPYPPTTIEEKLAKKNKLKARGNKESKKVQKTLLKQQYENFTRTSSKGVDQIYDRLQKLIINTTHGVSAASSKTNASNLPNIDSLSDAMAMLTMIARRFLQKTRRNLGVKGTETIGFNKTKASTQRNVPVEDTTSNSLVTQCDGLGYDWSDQAEDGPTNFALMAYTSSSSSNLDTEVSTCSKACLKSYKTLKEHYDNLPKDFNKSRFNLGAYKAGLASVEARLEVYKKNKTVFEDDIKILKLDVMLRDKAITELRQKFKKDKKERDDLKLTLEKFEGSSKNLSRLLEGQQSDKSKTGLGYDSQGVNSQVRTFNPRTAPQNNDLKETVNTAKGNPQFTLHDQGIIDSGCFRHMTGNKSFLTEYEEINDGYVAFGGLCFLGFGLTFAESDGFEKIVDFINANPIKYALTVSLTIYTLCIKQFWTSAKVKTVNEDVRLQSLVDGKKVIVNEASIRRDLRLDDAKGTACLPNAAIFEELARMGYEKPSQKLTFYKAFFSPQWNFLIHTILQCLSVKTTAWNEFSSTIASVIICLANNKKFNFSKYILDNMVKNLEAGVKFYMFPRFIQVFMNHQLGDMSHHKRIFVNPSLTKKEAQIKEEAKEENKGEHDQEMFGVNDLDGDEIVVDVSAGEKKEQSEKVSKKEVSTADLVTTVDEVVTTVDVKVSAALTTTTTTDDELTMTQTLIEIKAAKPKALTTAATIVTTVSTRPKEKGIIMQEPSETPSPKPIRKEQIMMDKQFARDLKAQMQVDLEEEKRIAKQKEEEANITMVAEWDNTQSKIFEEVQQNFNKTIDWINNFVAMDSEAVKDKAVESSKRAGDEIKQESAKRQRLKKEDDTAELKRCMEIVPEDDDDDVTIEATPISSKSPTIVDYKIYKEGKKSYFKIIMADGNSQNYLTFGTMFKNFNREDLEVLRSIVKERFKKTKPVDDMDNLLFQTLKTMFEHQIKDSIWKYQQGAVKVYNWKLFDSCGVYCVTTQRMVYYLLVEKMYPFTNNILHQLWKDVRLHVDCEEDMAYDLLRLTRRQIKEGHIPA